MVQITITFDRVFDIQRAIKPKQTLFGFQSRNIRQCGVTVPGWPEIEAGMTVTCLLSEADNWQTVQGWKNHATGEVVGPDISRMAVSVITCVLISLYSFVINLGATLNFPWIAKGVLGVFPIISIYGCIMIWNARKVFHRLRAVS
ncbi:MAG: hypothetical protein LBE81_01775 [Azonexus sp.]|jgi:hypothetical protein|uniref:hypothetical protein n=1 Tax=Azonexus sp. TaxID=1872668 RepID=UPI00281C29BD|nr:hypothetical protein [Azonexus sp.]MDR0775355.1 hypothetical protein [Azonexus sp.]